MSSSESRCPRKSAEHVKLYGAQSDHGARPVITPIYPRPLNGSILLQAKTSLLTTKLPLELAQRNQSRSFGRDSPQGKHCRRYSGPKKGCCLCHACNLALRFSWSCCLWLQIGSCLSSCCMCSRYVLPNSIVSFPTASDLIISLSVKVAL